MRCRNWPCLIVVLTSTTLLLWPAVVSAQADSLQKQDQAQSSGSSTSNADSREQLIKIEQRLKVLKQQPAHQPAVSRETEAFLMVDDSVKDVTFYQRNNGAHFFLTRLILVNQSQRPLKLVRSQIKATVDGKAYVVAGLPKNLNYQSVQLGKGKQQLHRLKFEDEVEVAPGKQGSLWIVFSDIQTAGQIPEFELQTMMNDQLLQLNVNSFELGKLKYTAQQMGPSQCLVELTITGELNSINIGSLMQTIDQLTAKNIKRFVIYFPNPKPDIDPDVKQWLLRAAELIGTNSLVEPRFPAFPSMITELHLAGEVFKDDKPRYPNLMPTQFAHATEEAAIHAALDSAMSLLSREKVAEQIRTGSPAVQVAGLISGGRQLTNAELPLVLELTEHKNAEVQLAALYSLRYLGDPRVFERLTAVAKRPPGPQFEMAIASLAESRFAEGQKVLLKLLHQQSPKSQQVIIGIIAQSPRPQWGSAIYNFLDSENLELRKAAIKALVLNGHPKLFNVLSDTLVSPQADLREVAFQELIKRKDSASETLALNYILAQLQQITPTREMLIFIDRLKEPRAIPLLFEHLQNSKLDAGMRILILKTLTSIGDQTVEPEFLKFYPQASVAEKLLILESLQKVGSPDYLKLVTEALQDSNLKIVNGTISRLKLSSSNEALLILKEKLQETKEPSTWQTIYSTLVDIGTPESRQVIMKMRYSGDINAKKQAALSALSRIYGRSPGRQYYKEGETQQNKDNWQAAIENYQTAISIDSQLVPAYLGIVNSKTSLKQYEDALKFADQGLKIDDKEPRLYLAKGLIYMEQSQAAAATKQFQNAIDIDPKNPFVYVVLASHYSQLRQFDKAIKACDAAIEINPKNFTPYMIKVRIYNETEQWDEAIKVYDQIIVQDQNHLDAYTGRGHVHLQKQDWKAAQKDFQKAFELDKENPQAISGLAICMVYNHEENKAISFIEEHAPQFEDNDTFQYNVACVFGRVLFNLKDQPKTPDGQKKIKSYQDQAIQYLTKSSQKGFDDADWMLKDPDLAELRDLPAFKSLVQTIKQSTEKPKP